MVQAAANGTSDCPLPSEYQGQQRAGGGEEDLTFSWLCLQVKPLFYGALALSNQ